MFFHSTPISVQKPKMTYPNLNGCSFRTTLTTCMIEVLLERKLPKVSCQRVRNTLIQKQSSGLLKSVKIEDFCQPKINNCISVNGCTGQCGVVRKISMNTCSKFEEDISKYDHSTVFL